MRFPLRIARKYYMKDRTHRFEEQNVKVNGWAVHPLIVKSTRYWRYDATVPNNFSVATCRAAEKANASENGTEERQSPRNDFQSSTTEEMLFACWYRTARTIYISDTISISISLSLSISLDLSLALSLALCVRF